MSGEASARAGGTEVPLLGRERELSLVRDVLARAEAGQVVLIHGPAGMGKTRLVDEAVADLDAVPVLRGRAHALDGELAFVSLVEALSPYLDDCSDLQRRELLDGLDVLGDVLDGYGLQPPDRTPGERLVRTRRLEALRRLVGRIGQERGVVLVLDDVHWADQETLEAIAHLGRDLARLRLAVVLTYRRDEAGPALRSTLAGLRRHPDAVDVGLEPLASASVRDVVAAWLGGEPGVPLQRLVEERAGGVPLFVTALLAHLDEQGQLERRGTTWHARPGAEAAVPAIVHDLLLARTTDLDDEVRELLDVVAVAGASVRIDRLARLCGRAVDGIDRQVDVLIASGLLTERDAAHPTVDVAHPLIGEAAYQRIPDRVRRRWHARLAADLERDGHPDLGRLARHHRAAGAAIDPARAFDTLVRAGRRALDRAAHAEAIGHLQAALELVRGGLDRRRGPVLARLGEAWAMRGEHDVARELLTAAARHLLDEDDPDGAAAAHGQLATLEHYARHPGQALQHLDRALELLASPTSPTAVGLLYRKAHLAQFYEQADELTHTRQELGLLADRLAMPAAVFAAEMTAAWEQQAVGRFDAAADHARRALAVLDDEGEWEGYRRVGVQARAHSVIAQAAAAHGDAVTLAAVAGPIRETAAQLGVSQLAWRLEHARWVLATQRGNWEEADEAAAAITLALPDPPQDEAFGPVFALGAFVRERPDVLAAEMASPLEEQLPGPPASVRADTELAHAVLTGDASRVAAALEVPPSRLGYVPSWAVRARGLAALLIGRTDTARQQADWLASMGGPGTATAVQAREIRVASLLGTEPDAARDLAVEAVETADGLGMRPARSRLQLWLARAHQAVGATDPAVAAARAALATAEELELARTADAARALLRDLGVRVAAPSDGADVLTPRQREIAALVAEGLSNAEIAERLFISVRTVTTHLDHVYRRLDISSRAALASWMTRRK